MADLTQITEIAEQTLYDLAIPEYQSVPRIGYQLCEVLPWEDRFMYGERLDSVTDFGEPDEVPFGVELPDRSAVSGWKVYAKGRKIGHKVSLPRETVIAAAATGRLPSTLEDLFRGQGRRFVQQQEKFIADYIQQGTLTAGNRKYFDNSFPGEADPYPTVGYDGLPLFDTAHALKLSSTTPSNHTVSGALNQTNLEAALTLMETTSAVDERGEPIMNMMDTLIVPANGLRFTASVLIETAQKSGSANNDINPIAGQLQVLPWRYLTDDADAWFLARLNSGRRSLRLRDSGEPRFNVYEDPKTHMIVFEMFKYYSLTHQDWRGLFCANKAAS